MVPGKRTVDRILLVDDLALVRRSVPARLGALGCKVTAVASAAEAWESIERTPPDLVLLDVVLPGKDGFALCRGLKADPRFRAIPVVMFTDVGGHVFERSLEAGADDYLPKRIEDAFLRIRVHLHLHVAELRHRAERVPDGEGQGTLLLATQSNLLKAQFSAQVPHASLDVQSMGSLDEALAAITGRERLLVVDMDLAPDGLHGFLSQLRMAPESARLPILLLCDKEQLDRLLGLEFMLDDVMLKPLTASVTRHRLKLLLDMAQLLEITA